MRTHDRGVHETREILVADRDGAEDITPAVTIRPPVEAIVDGLPAAESLRQVTPWRARLGDPDDRIDKVAVAHRRWSASTAWQQWLHPCPRLV